MKKFLTLLLALTIILSIFSAFSLSVSAGDIIFASVSSDSTDYSSVNDDLTKASYLGDANHDGIVNSTDALLMLKHSVGSGSIGAKYMNDADMNGDAIINSTDALIALKTSVGGKSLELAPKDRVLYYISDGNGGWKTTYTPTEGASYVNSEGTWVVYRDPDNYGPVSDGVSDYLANKYG